MSKRWYGSINNRIEEGHQYCETIEVGTKMTEYMWSDSHVYEVTKVDTQEHVWVRRMSAKSIGGFASNEWELTSNPNAPEIELVKRFNGWNILTIYNKAKMLEIATKRVDNKEGVANKDYSREEQINVEYRFMLYHANLSEAQTRRLNEGKDVKKYEKWNNISFGIAREYYDYEF